jgi:type I restriction enzyme, S subunit
VIGLPEGWATATLEELSGRGGLVTDGDWIESKDQDPQGDIRLIQLMDVGDGRFLDRSKRYVNRETSQRLRCTLLTAGDVLIARMPDPIGRACVFPRLAQDAITAVDVLVWRGGEDGAFSPWLVYALNSPKVRAIIQAGAGGTTRQRIAGGRLKALELPIPPLQEQRRIVATLDALVARSARARADLDRIPVLAARYKQAVLAAAFSGVLTVDLRGSGEWGRARIGEILDVATGMTPPKSDAGSYGGGIPFVKPGDLDQGEIYKTEDSLTAAGFSRARQLPAGTVLVSCIGNLGKTGILAVPGTCNQQINAILPNERFYPHFVHYWAQTLSSWLKDSSSATTIAIVNKSRFLCAEIPLTPRSEQKVIVSRLAIAFAEIDRLVAEAAAARRLLDRLDQAILAKAFRGELVPQDPADESASVLLDRIRSERGEATTHQRGRRKG